MNYHLTKAETLSDLLIKESSLVLAKIMKFLLFSFLFFSFFFDNFHLIFFSLSFLIIFF